MRTALQRSASLRAARQRPVAAPPDAARPCWLPHFRGLRAVVAVADQGTVVAAAQVLHLSQPAVTRALRGLEDALGLALFERGARGMLPTAAGRILAVRARRTFTELASSCACAQGTAHNAQVLGQRFAAMVTPHLLDSLVAVAEQGSAPQAGHLLGRAQPTVHRNLAEIERLVGVALFHRSPLGTRLTDAGQTLLCGVKRALADLAVAHEELAAFDGRPTAQIRIAALPLSSGFLIPRVLERLMACQPHLQVTILDGTYDAMLQHLRRAEVDLIVGALRSSPPADLEQQALFEDRLEVVARAGHPCLAAPAQDLAALVHANWIAPLPDTPARLAFAQMFDSAGLAQPQSRLQVNSPALVRTLLLAGDRLALVSPLQIAAELRSGELAVVPLGRPPTLRTIGVTTRQGARLSPAVQAVCAELRAVAAQLGSELAQTHR